MDKCKNSQMSAQSALPPKPRAEGAAVNTILNTFNSQNREVLTMFNKPC